MIAVTNLGREIQFNSENIPLVGRGNKGVKGLVGSKLKKNEEIIDVRFD